MNDKEDSLYFSKINYYLRMSAGLPFAARVTRHWPYCIAFYPCDNISPKMRVYNGKLGF